MTLVIDLSPEIEHRLNVEAARKGQQPSEFVTHLLERELESKEFDLDALLALPRQEQERIMQKAFDDAASEYNADLARPAAQRELTAFTALDGDDFADSE
jgi:predicted DNA-binding protein